MFPEINKIFRKKGSLSLPTFKITDSNILIKANINPSDLTLDKAGKFLVSDDNHKSQLIGTHFAEINSKNDNFGNPHFNEFIAQEARILKSDFANQLTSETPLCTFSDINLAYRPSQILEFADYFTFPLAVEKKFRGLNNKKSSGNDKIPNIALKHIPSLIAFQYTILFNNMLNLGYFPAIWKKAKVIALLKKGKEKSDPTGYRPISLLPNIGKIYEKIINDIIILYCDKLKLIPESQYGFKAHHSTLHAINKILSDISWALNDRKCVGTCLVDLEKAFDTIWLDGLIFKLKNKKLPLYILKLITHMITDRSFVVSSGSTLSDREFFLTSGLQQGTINSPILFNIYTSDLLDLFGPQKTDCTLLAFADDLIVYYAGRNPLLVQNKLKVTLEKIFNYYTVWKLKVNISKCECTLFRESIHLATYLIQKNYKNFKLEVSQNNEVIPI